MEQAEGSNEQWQEQLQQRLAMRRATGSTPRPDPSSFSNLDGSIKKNTAFIKKLRAGISASQLATFKKDLLGLKLEKYLEEVAISIVEGTHKSSQDILAAVELCTMLDQRFEGFMPLLLPTLVKAIRAISMPPASTSGGPGSFAQQQHSTSTASAGAGLITGEKEEQLRLSRLRSCMRLLIELNLVGLVVDSGRQKYVPGVLQELFAQDKTHANVNLAVAFVKYYYNFYGPSDIIANPSPEKSELTTEAICLDCHKVLSNYYQKIQASLVKEHEKLQKQEKSNQDLFITRGEILEDKMEVFERRTKAFEKLKIATQCLSSYLKLEMPELAKEEEVTKMTIGSITDGRMIRMDREEGSLGAWEDEESKSFYENIPDLANQVPGILLGIKSKSAGSNNGDEIAAPDETSPVAEEPPAAVEAEENVGEDEHDTARPNTTAFGVFAAKLSTSLNRESIDQLSLEFAFMNNKGTRRQLTQILLGVSRQRMDLIPYYSRLIAILNPYMSDIGTAVVEELESTFHYRQKKKEQVFIEEKMKNIRFIGELTKFKVTPSHVVFHCIKVLLDDFNFHNIELLCTLLETCGRFLFFNLDTNARTVNYLEILQKKKTSLNMVTKYAFMIDNAIYTCNPPEFVAAPVKVREPIELFLRNLIYKKLSRSSVEGILKLLRKANWNDPLVLKALYKLFFKIWKVKFSNLHLMAFLVSELSHYYPDFGVAVVDNTLEDIRVDLERNIFKHNQRRISAIRFLGELYNYRMIDSGTAFETLYLLLRFGHAHGIPFPGVYCPFDAPDDFFRLRLVCTLLDTCGTCFRKGHTAKKLDNFFVFMQMYVFTKSPISVDAEFFILETLELLRPNIKLIETFEECVEQVNAIAKADVNAEAEEEEIGEEEERRETLVEEEEDDEEDEEEYDEDDEEEDEEDEDDDDDEDEDEEDEEEEDEEEVIVLEKADQEVEEDSIFEREFGRLMQESMDSRRTDRKAAVFDAPIPTRKAQELRDDIPVKEGEVAFTLLTKKGNKQQAKQIILPSSSTLVTDLLEKKAAEQEERIHLKKLVLGYQETSATPNTQDRSSQQSKPANIIKSFTENKPTPPAPKSKGRIVYSGN